MKQERRTPFTIEAMHLDDIVEADAMRLDSWLETYPNEEYGVTREWILSRNAEHKSPEKLAARRNRLINGRKVGTGDAWVARDDSGKIIGLTTPFINKHDIQHVGSLYVEKKWHGKGVAAALMQRVIDWFDSSKPIELGVATYNERAKAFYRKWGFEEMPDSETLFDGKIPEIVMIRKAEK